MSGHTADDTLVADDGSTGGAADVFQRISVCDIDDANVEYRQAERMSKLEPLADATVGGAWYATLADEPDSKG